MFDLPWDIIARLSVTLDKCRTQAEILVENTDPVCEGLQVFPRTLFQSALSHTYRVGLSYLEYTDQDCSVCA